MPSPVDEEDDEQARRPRPGHLKRDVEQAGTVRVPGGEGPAPVEDVSVERPDRERQRRRESVRNPEQEQQPVGDEADDGVGDADGEEAGELQPRGRTDVGVAAVARPKSVGVIDHGAGLGRPQQERATRTYQQVEHYPALLGIGALTLLARSSAKGDG